LARGRGTTITAKAAHGAIVMMPAQDAVQAADTTRMPRTVRGRAGATQAQATTVLATARTLLPSITNLAGKTSETKERERARESE